MGLKENINQLIIEERYEEIIELGKLEPSKTSRYVQMNIFGWDDQERRWQAIEALGRLSKELGKEQDELYRNVIRRCLWAMNDESGNVPWGAAELMAAVIKGQPEKYDYFIKMMITNALHNPICYKGMLWGIAHLGVESKKEIEPFLERVLFLLDDDDAEIRTYCVWALLELRYVPVKSKLLEMSNDLGEGLIYRNQRLERISIKALIEEKGKNV